MGLSKLLSSFSVPIVAFPKPQIPFVSDRPATILNANGYVLEVVGVQGNKVTGISVY